MGDSTPPWGTPVSCGNGSRTFPPIRRAICDCVVHDLSIEVKLSGMPIRSRTFHAMGCETETYAFLKSRNTRTVSWTSRTR